jgi:hypothetical protein
LKPNWIVSASILCVCILSPVLRADDDVNPAFQAWTAFGVGSSSTFESTIDSPHGKSTTTTTMTLLEKAADHVVIETSQLTMMIDGKSQTIPAMKTTIPAAKDPSKEQTQVGTEDVTAAGKTFSCKIYTPTHPKSGVQGQIKVWASTDVPGGAVKMEVNMSMMKISGILKSFEVK